MKYDFGIYSIDLAARTLTASGEPVRIEPKVFDLLALLVANAERAISKEELVETVWHGRVISDAAISSAVSAARRAIGDTGKDQQAIRTLHGRGYRFVGRIDTPFTAPLPRPTDRPTAPVVQDIRYFTSFDGTRIAYSILGDSGPTLVKTANWMTHLEYDLESPVWRHWIDAIGTGCRLVRYDERGNGLSDRNPATLSYEACVRDLECLVRHLGLMRFSLFGISQGAPIAVDAAVRNPGPVDKIIIYGGFARGWRFDPDPAMVDQRIAMSMLMRAGWGQENPEFRQLFTSRFMPEATPEQADWFNDLQRKCVEPGMAARLHDMFGEIDVLPLLEKVEAATLVLHARGDRETPIDKGRVFATRIPGARFVSLESRNHILLKDEPAFAVLVEQVQRFLH